MNIPTVAKVLTFIKDPSASDKLRDFIHTKLLKLDLPDSQDTLEADEDLLDQILDNNLAFHFSDPDNPEDVVILGYTPDSHTLIVRGGMSGDIFPVSLEDLELYSLLELATLLSY